MQKTLEIFSQFIKSGIMLTIVKSVASRTFFQQQQGRVLYASTKSECYQPEGKLNKNKKIKMYQQPQ